MSIDKFQDRDADYLDWLAAHHAGYVINIGRSERGYARLHHATCATISTRPPFTGPFIKICSAAVTELDQWALRRSGTVPQRCGTCQPPGYIAPTTQQAGPVRTDRTSQLGMPTGHEWEIDGHGDHQRQVWLWAARYIPFERLTADQHDARAALRLRVRSLTAATGEILDASYAGFKPTNMDVENLLLYNIDATARGCFQPGTRHGVRFEMASGPRRDPPSGLALGCSYQYRLISPDSELSHWRRVRRLADFANADLGRFLSSKRLEQVWLAIRSARVQTAGQPAATAAPFAVLLTLDCPITGATGVDPELVKALMDGTVAAFQAHRDRTSVAETATRLAATTGRSADLMAQLLIDNGRAVLGITDRLVYLRGTGVQWNPADHLCVAGQVVCRRAPGTEWTLSGEIHAVEQAAKAGWAAR